MNEITTELFNELVKVSNKDTNATSLIKSGIELLNNKPISKNLKKEVLKAVLQKIAYGHDGIAGTEDDRLSYQTLNVLTTIIESDVIDEVINGIVVGIKKSGFKELFNRCGILIRFKKF